MSVFTFEDKTFQELLDKTFAKDYPIDGKHKAQQMPKDIFSRLKIVNSKRKSKNLINNSLNFHLPKSISLMNDE